MPGFKNLLFINPVQFRNRFYKYFINSGYSLPSLYPSAAHQSIVLTHQQLCFYLLQSIEDNTYHNQQRCTTKRKLQSPAVF